MHTYSVKYGDSNYIIIAESRSKAKTKLYHELGCDLGYDYFQFIYQIKSVIKLHSFKPSDLFHDDFDFEKTKIKRGLPAHVKIGSRVIVDGKHGTICGANASLNLDICFDGKSYLSNCHPGWKMEFIESVDKNDVQAT